MKIITGGAGFIGSAICWKLNTLGYRDILIVDADIEGTKKNNLSNLRYLEVIDKDKFLDNLNNGMYDKKVETLYHMGACSSTTEQDMEFLLKNNVAYSKTLAKWCLSNNSRFIYASSAATYGEGEAGYDDDHSIIPHLKPMNKYGLSKQLFDLWVLNNNLINKIVGLKYFNVYGPNENHKGEMRSMVNKSYKRIVDTGKMELFKSYKPEYKNGEQKRDFIYIKDAVDMTLHFDLDENGKNANGIYNVGTGNAVTWNKLANAIFIALKLEPKIEYVEMPDNIKNQYQYFTEANIAKLRNAGYKKPIPDVNNTVYDYVVNYLSKDKYLTP